MPSCVLPLDQLISRSNGGINLQSSYTFYERISALCYLPPEVTNRCAPGYKMHFSIKPKTVKNDFEYARGKVAYTY
nr:MAG TPA: hypothetical protein [Caudoviricetes sp.]